MVDVTWCYEMCDSVIGPLILIGTAIATIHQYVLLQKKAPCKEVQNEISTSPKQ